ncbi:hypothetical protein RBWH47_05603 [Rhodopirellula baltica WH47]|uniref:Uncharacterized protein n=1 Tax=Rhodopirellula baltica WH47 TaxID=991778 RepID=F2ATH3_RHOBT|nr:hypothetical protein RBWH47_05603 [Rhodopirellula baltica WH47]
MAGAVGCVNEGKCLRRSLRHEWLKECDCYASWHRSVRPDFGIQNSRWKVWSRRMEEATTKAA